MYIYVKKKNIIYSCALFAVIVFNICIFVQKRRKKKKFLLTFDVLQFYIIIIRLIFFEDVLMWKMKSLNIINAECLFLWSEFVLI